MQFLVIGLDSSGVLLYEGWAMGFAWIYLFEFEFIAMDRDYVS